MGHLNICYTTRLTLSLILLSEGLNDSLYTQNM